MDFDLGEIPNKKYFSIQEVSKILDIETHTIRYWEKEFRQIKPYLISGRRFYSKENLKLILYIKYLLKDKGFSISGAKKMIMNRIKRVDDNDTTSIKNDYIKKNIKTKSLKILQKIKKLNNYGKKNSY